MERRRIVSAFALVVIRGAHGFEASIQEEVKQILDSHRDAEKALGAEIHPAARKQSFTPEGIADDDRKCHLLANAAPN